MNDTLFPEIPAKPIRIPKTADGDVRPTWGKYRTVKPVQCDDCAAAAYESLMAHEGFDGIRVARFKRSQGATARLLCDAHTRAQREADKIKWPSKRVSG